MKRIHLFEIEDLEWFPESFRRYLTRLILVMHRIIGTEEKVSALLADLIKDTDSTRIVDLCSGSGGPMPEVLLRLQEKYNLENISLTLTDLYPDLKTAEILNQGERNSMEYITTPINAAEVDENIKGIRTMISSFHHMKPDNARKILENAEKARQPILIFEISDNNPPVFLWWIAIPINFIMALFITPWVRPMSWKQLFFTYLIPIIPLCFAWDGAVSNARTYTLDDLDELLEGLSSESYKWEKGKIKGKTNQLYLIGKPV